MREMRLLGLSEDHTQLLLTGPETGTVALPLDDRLRAAVLGDQGRLDTLGLKAISALSPREIQARLRAGVPANEVALAAGVSLERIRRFEGPVRDERLHIVEEARRTIPRDGNGRVPLGDTVTCYLVDVGVDPTSVSWDSWRREDGTWLVQVRFDEHGRQRTAHWVWDPLRRQVTVADADAAELLAAERAEDDLLGLAAAVTSGHPSRSPADIRPAGLTLVRGAEADAPVVADDAAQAADAAQVAFEPDPDHESEQSDDTAPPPPPAAHAHDERRNGATDRQAEEDGVEPGRRATVPSWDEILFGARPPEG